MGELVLQGPVAEIVARNAVTADDVARLRREVFRDGVVCRPEADALFAIDTSCRSRVPEWDAFFIDAVSDYLVNREAPKGYVSDANADWLISAISRDGIVCTRTEVELLIAVMERATAMPASLSAFALRQVAHVVTDGDGPLARGRTARPGVVTADDVAMLKRILYAYGGGGNAGITRDEAEVLFDINDRTAEADNDPAWSDLFVKAIGFSLMAATRHQAATRETALQREAWLADDSVDVAGFFSRVFAGGLKGYKDAVMTKTGVENAWRETNQAFAEATAAAETIDTDEADWIARRMGRDGLLHENEKALLRFIRDESPDVHPSLAPLIDQVA
ncbi:MAG: hypothetical protein JJ926_01815 [Roseitalea sp.]|uniref:hypothetical protein n=1 Tax=Oceaniradius stylonematis TaxID=2184161 RepID=UPI001B057CC1|nr:hypothetical protein [Roseitalea sp.]MBO6950596.1 hypothetical protein [Rhizobiaceae bacterium]MBO6591417.1 hypothetical protein [Roseitalea sp.]MBO6599272.1 hypothetical protein [Roseitalea sp.]MBO6613386.1 hypothetical protein [Roseitalea sp.]